MAIRYTNYATGYIWCTCEDCTTISNISDCIWFVPGTFE